MNKFWLLLNRYSKTSDKLHVVFRWLMCPFERMEKYIPKKGTVIDVGCGEGVLTIYLALTSKDRKVVGIDIDGKRLSTAQDSSRDLKNIRFLKQPATQIKERCNGVIISDVFHHLSSSDQEVFLKICSQKIVKGGTLVIKEINKSDFIRSKLSRLWDYLLYPQDKILYWSKNDIVRKLTELGFTVKTKSEVLYFPGSTHLYICTKK